MVLEHGMDKVLLMGVLAEAPLHMEDLEAEAEAEVRMELVVVGVIPAEQHVLGHTMGVVVDLIIHDPTLPPQLA